MLLPMKHLKQDKAGNLSLISSSVRSMLLRSQSLRHVTRKGKFPDFLIIGAQKAGTTSLFHYLSQHPSVQPPSTKEIHYYDIHYHKGANWYKKIFKLVNKDKITGEATPYYLFHPFVPERVHRDNPDTKIIVLLRHPGERAFSHYQMMRRMNIEKAATFSEAIKAEPARLKTGLKTLYNNPLALSPEHQHYTYLSRGKYEKQLRRWFHSFNALLCKSIKFQSSKCPFLFPMPSPYKLEPINKPQLCNQLARNEVPERCIPKIKTTLFILKFPMECCA